MSGQGAGGSAGIDPALLDFSGRRVLVTGAAGGIGGAMARAFARHGASLVLADRDNAGLEAIAAELDTSGDVERHLYDQADRESVVALAADVGRVDVLMNNAGMMAFGPLLEHAPEVIEEVVLTNLVGPMVLARAVAPAMLAHGRGVIVNTASQLAFAGASERAVYAAAKAGLVQFTRTVAAEWAAGGVRVVALAPGRTLTAINAAVLATEVDRAAALEHIPHGRFGEAAEMARLAVLLASDLADYVVGETLIADGGYVVAD